MKSTARKRFTALVASAAALAAPAAALSTAPAEARAADGPTVLARHLVAPLSLTVNRQGTAFVSQNFGGPIAKVRDGDLIRLHPERGELTVLAELGPRAPAEHVQPQYGWGRELFASFRRAAGPAETGGGVI